MTVGAVVAVVAAELTDELEKGLCVIVVVLIVGVVVVVDRIAGAAEMRGYGLVALVMDAGVVDAWHFGSVYTTPDDGEVQLEGSAKHTTKIPADVDGATHSAQSTTTPLTASNCLIHVSWQSQSQGLPARSRLVRLVKF